MISGTKQAIRQAKLERLRDGGVPRALEICSGCGGLSLGLKAAGFELTAHIEVDPEAAGSYALNFGAERLPNDPWLLPRDMEKGSAADLVADLGLATDAAESFDLLAAGLPCQAFARIGRSKLRELSGGEDDAFQKDPRAALYRRFLTYVEDTQPLVILIENVPDILNFGGHNVPEEICQTLEEAGYRTGYTILNAAYFGVPQVRERLFIIALATELERVPEFPVPTHYLDLPRGYESSRRVALKHVDLKSGRFHEINTPSNLLPTAIGAKDALTDLPIILEHLTDPTSIKRRKLTDRLHYRLPEFEASAYASTMRNWPTFPSPEDTDGHLVRLTPRDFPIFASMLPGDDYPQALELAERMLAEAEVERGLTDSSLDSDERRKLRSSIVPPYDPKKFPNKWWKLDPLKPSRTLTAHMGKDTYSHIHYDGEQRRTISVREAARLQSFPDGFKFAGAMNAAFRQIGNAVPPLLGLAVARVLKGQLAARDAEESSGLEAA